jgi:hypothetical protein
MSATVKYTGTRLPRVEAVEAGSVFQVITVTSPNQVLTLQNVIAVWLLEHQATEWEAAEGWEPPPIEPEAEEVQVVTSAYTLKGKNKIVIGRGVFNVTVPDARIWANKTWTIRTGTENSVLTLLPEVAGQKFVETTSEKSSIVVSKASAYNSVTIVAVGSVWYVI